MGHRWLSAGLVMMCLALGACNRPFREAPNPVEIDAREYDRIFTAAVDVLRDYGFRVNRQDHRFGRVTTYPLDSPTAFEPWRSHNTTAEQTWQSTFTSLRRTVTVFIEPQPQDQPQDQPRPRTQEDETASLAYALRVEVLLENHQFPNRRLIPAQGSRMFSTLHSIPQAWRERGIEDSYWTPIGRDPYLEDRLIRAIVESSLRIPSP